MLLCIPRASVWPCSTESLQSSWLPGRGKGELLKRQNTSSRRECVQPWSPSPFIQALNSSNSSYINSPWQWLYSFESLVPKKVMTNHSKAFFHTGYKRKPEECVKGRAFDSLWTCFKTKSYESWKYPSSNRMNLEFTRQTMHYLLHHWQVFSYTRYEQCRNTSHFPLLSF